MPRDPNEYHLLTFDGGGTTGWAHFTLDYRAFSRPENKALAYLKEWDTGEFTGSENEQLSGASTLIRNAKYGDMPFHSYTDCVAEDFELTQTIGGNNLLSPVRINAVLAWECHKQGVTFSTQKRSMRTNVTPQRLTLMGFDSPMNRGGRWTKTGKGKDSFAAMQHGIVWLRRIKAISQSKPWKLGDGQTHNAYWDCSCSVDRNGKRHNRKRRCNLVHPPD